MGEYFFTLAGNRVVQTVALMVAADTVFGILRAAKQGKFNSSLGLDGAVRKITMLLSLVFLDLLDRLVAIDLSGFVPREVLAALGLAKLGTAEFFALLFIAYEAVSVLKNMALCGLPVKKVRGIFEDYLRKYTDELPKEKGEDK